MDVAWSFERDGRVSWMDFWVSKILDKPRFDASSANGATHTSLGCQAQDGILLRGGGPYTYRGRPRCRAPWVAICPSKGAALSAMPALYTEESAEIIVVWNPSLGSWRGSTKIDHPRFAQSKDQTEEVEITWRILWVIMRSLPRKTKFHKHPCIRVLMNIQYQLNCILAPYSSEPPLTDRSSGVVWELRG